MRTQCPRCRHEIAEAERATRHDGLWYHERCAPAVKRSALDTPITAEGICTVLQALFAGFVLLLLLGICPPLGLLALLILMIVPVTRKSRS